MRASFFDLTFSDLQNLLTSNGLHASAASHLYNWHYKKKETAPCQIKIATATQDFLKQNFEFSLPEISAAKEAPDKTVKFLFRLKDGYEVESVLIPFHKKYSICVSSQVGCAMNCSFCFTGTQGLKRNLSTSEIIGQYLQAWSWLKDKRPGEERISNVVFMGQGEPLHNFEPVKKACEIFLSQSGISIAAQKITVSTSGYLPGLKKWTEQMPGVNLALSLHSPFEKKRNELIPINKAFPLEEVLSYIERIPLARKQFVTYEYLLIDGFNDSAADAHETGKLLKGRPAYINLIPFNPFPGSHYKRPPLQTIEAFKCILDTYKIPTIVRTTKGDEVLAACGQLNTQI